VAASGVLNEREEASDAMAQAVALIDDLFFHAKVAETARQLGVELRIFTAAEPMLAEMEKETPKLVMLDLNARADAVGAIARVQQAAARAGGEIAVVAFLSHVQTELAERAKAAGCEEVMPRSVFTRNLATILGRAKSERV
jgi:CheY-like chemotaxis protein